MVHPVQMAWTCCETCEYFGDSRQFTTLGLVAQHDLKRVVCSCPSDDEEMHNYPCDNYLRWRALA